MSEGRLYELLLWGMFGVALATALFSLFMPAPYGRYGKPWWAGPSLRSRAAWVLMELPQPLGMAVCFALATRRAETGTLVLGAMWMLHYAYRVLVYPFIPRSSSMSLFVVLLGMILNVGFGYLNGRWLFALGPARGSEWLYDPRFLIGAGLFFGGLALSASSDLILRSLRKPGETGYRIPTRGAFRYVSSPNYLGELLEWAGWALATFSWAGLALWAVSAANLVPRAVRNHRWYKRQFPEYPPERHALVPLLF